MMPTVMLRDMNDEEFAAFRDGSIGDYAEELVVSGQCDVQNARAQSEADFQGALPQGLSTPHHHVMIAENADGAAVGMIWYETENPQRAFIEDFVVYEGFRRRGYGRAILARLERALRDRAVPAIRLHVFEHNASAIALYAGCGFERVRVDDADAGSLYMEKRL